MSVPTTTRPKHIVFDFGGVLFGWHPPSLMRRELPHLAYDDDSAVALAARFFGSYGGDWSRFDRGELTLPEVTAAITSRTGLALADVQRVVDGVPRELSPIEATVQWLHRLHADGKGSRRQLYYLSNMPAPFADQLEREHAFLGCFTTGVFSGRERVMKPEPAVYELATKRFGQAPADLVFFDDHAANVAAAQAAGWNALLFTSAAQAEADLASRGWW